MKREAQYGAFSHLYIVPKVTVTLWYPETSTSLCHSIGKQSKNNPADQHTDSNPALTIVEDSHRLSLTQTAFKKKDRIISGLLLYPQHHPDELLQTSSFKIAWHPSTKPAFYSHFTLGLV